MANASEWRERVAAWRTSGLSAAQFCADKDYSEKSLWHWSSRLGRSAQGGGRGRPTSGVAPEPRIAVARLVRTGESSSSGSVVVELNGARIEVQGAVPAATLRAVFDGLHEASAGRSR